MTGLIGRFKVYLKNVRSGKILNKIGAGKRVFFENPFEGIAFKYIPGEIGKLSKYYVKHFGREECEIDSNSPSILKAVMEGKTLSKTKYDNYCIIDRVSWNFGILTTEATSKAAGS